MNCNYHCLALFLTLSFLSCQHENPNANLRLDCDSVKEIAARDQDLRKTKLAGQFYPLVDSIMKSKGYARGLGDASSIDTELKSEIWNEATSLERPLSRKELNDIDATWKIQKGIDSLNTLHIIRLIEVFGIDSLNTIDSKCGKNSLLVFVHCPDDLKDKVAEVVEKKQRCRWGE